MKGIYEKHKYIIRKYELGLSLLRNVLILNVVYTLAKNILKYLSYYFYCIFEMVLPRLIEYIILKEVDVEKYFTLDFISNN